MDIWLKITTCIWREWKNLKLRIEASGEATAKWYHRRERHKEIKRLNKQYLREDRQEARAERARQTESPAPSQAVPATSPRNRRFGMVVLVCITLVLVTLWGTLWFAGGLFRSSVSIFALISLLAGYAIYKKDRVSGGQHTDRQVETPVTPAATQRTTTPATTATTAYQGQTTTSWWPVIVTVVVVMIGIGIYKHFSQPRESVGPTTSVITTPPNIPSRLPAEIVLPIIAECESGGRQFDDAGNVIENQTTSAVGKYQILEKLHGEKAKAMVPPLDLRTLEGNEAYAKFLYETSGTLHWDADPKSRACRESKLLALGYKIAPSTPFTDFNLIVRSGEPGKLIIPVWRRWDWAGPIPKGWTIVSDQMDAQNNRVQIFEVVPPTTEVTLPIRMSQCATRQECAW